MKRNKYIYLIFAIIFKLVNPEKMSTIAIFPGSFDPFTIGHQNIVKRALPLFDKLIIAIGHNTQKSTFQPISERLEQLKALYADESKVEIAAYSCLTVDYAAKINAQYIVRGVRTIMDYEYEKTIADANRELSGIETILLFTEPQLSHISSSLVRELAAFGKDISPYLPKA